MLTEAQRKVLTELVEFTKWRSSLGKSAETVLVPYDIFVELAKVHYEPKSLTDVNDDYIIGALVAYNGHRSKAAKALGIARETLHRTIKRLKEEGRMVPEPVKYAKKRSL
jgi:transcriptional regulator of acetoin/glycerol metabolism